MNARLCLTRKLVMCASIALAAACDSATSPTDAAAGVYVLSQVDGASLPAEIITGLASEPLTIRFESGSFELKSDGRFVYTLKMSATFMGETETISQRVEGTWDVSGSTATFRATSVRVNGGSFDPGSDALHAQIVDGRLTITEEDDGETHTMVFVR